MTYAVIGTGAVGGYFGAKLAKAGREVHFLLHSDYQEVKNNGLKVQSVQGNFDLPVVNAYDDVRQMPACDVIIVALKTTNNALLPSLVKPLLKENSMVLLIQNGIGVEEDVEKLLPGVPLLAGLAFICAAKNHPGLVEHQALGRIAIAPYHKVDDSLLTQMADEWNAAGIPTKVDEYQHARWNKALWNIPFNGLSVVLQNSTYELTHEPQACTLVRAMMKEVAEAAQAYGATAVNDDIIEKMIEMTRNMTPYLPSMRLDYDFNRPMEIEYIYTKSIEMAARKGVKMYHTLLLEKSLRHIQTVLDSQKTNK